MRVHSKSVSMGVHKERRSVKQAILDSLSEDVVNVIYLTIFFGLFTAARRLTLAHFGIDVDDYFIALVKALVIARVIRIGAFLKISRKFDDKPLVIPVLFKVALFVLLVILFDATESLIRGIIDTRSLEVAFDELIQHHFSKFWIGGLLMVMLAFIPFFMLKELGRVIGNLKFRDLFLKSRRIQNTGNSK
jgi:hypothetical protein